MILYIVALRDIVANVYHPPMSVPNLGSAIRSFGDACQNRPPDNQVGQHPEDYELYHVGYFNDATGEFHTEGDTWKDEDDQEVVIKRKQIAVGANYRQK